MSSRHCSPWCQWTKRVSIWGQNFLYPLIPVSCTSGKIRPRIFSTHFLHSARFCPFFNHIPKCVNWICRTNYNPIKWKKYKRMPNCLTFVQGCIFVWPIDFLSFLSDDILDFNLDRALIWSPIQALTRGGFIYTSRSWLSVTSSSFQCCWTRMVCQTIERYQLRCHFAEPQKG